MGNNQVIGLWSPGTSSTPAFSARLSNVLRKIVLVVPFIASARTASAEDIPLTTPIVSPGLGYLEAGAQREVGQVESWYEHPIATIPAGWLELPSPDQQTVLVGDSVPRQPQAASPTGQDAAPSAPNVRPEDHVLGRQLLDGLEMGFVARGYYRNDQRIQWSGVEETFGAEGVIMPRLKQACGDWEITIDSEFYLNQPYNRNVLLDTAERRSYASNFCIDTFEISRLLLAVRRGDFTFVVGKMDTPFGRTYFPLYSNARLDAPFIRTESILWRETGMLARYKPGFFIADLALVNGCENLDTNSSKSIISRVGLEHESWAVGCSVKIQDGIGSEDRKEYKNHVGVDMMVRQGAWRLSGECIYDQYGFTRPIFNPLDITWDRSLYYRNNTTGRRTAITGIGYYGNLDYQRGRWTATLNYGEFYPQNIGDVQHDRVQRRGIIKLAFDFTSRLQAFSVVMLENDGYIAQEDRLRRGLVVLSGLQYVR